MTRFLTALLAAGAVALALSTLVASSGCEAVAYVGQAIDSETDVEFTAKYDGLNDKRIAVLVDAPMDVQFEHPTAVPRLCDYISEWLRESSTGAQILPSNYAVAFQANNVYWPTMDTETLASTLKVDRLIIVDLVEYRLQAPGNSYLWDGVITADIHVFEADSMDPTTPAFSERVKSRFPPMDGVPRDKEPREKIEQGLQIVFSRDAARLFYTYSRKKGDIDKDIRKERHRL